MFEFLANCPYHPAKTFGQIPESPLIEKPTTTGTFLQFFFKPTPLAQLIVPSILKKKQSFGRNPFTGLKDPSDPSKGQKKIIVEFSSPNIAKPFHAGHLRSTIIGGFLANLYEAAGWNVYRMNYLGDWGKQYGLLALGFAKFGSEERLKEDPIGHLFDVYVKINQDLKAEKEEFERLEQAGEDVTAKKAAGLDEQARAYFKAMTDNNEKAIAQWKRFRDLSITKYKTTYARLNIHFDEYCGESQVEQERMDATAKILEEKGITEESDGALIVDFIKHVPGKAGKSLERPILKKKDGTALYLTRDISEMIKRDENHRFDKMFYVVAAAQDLHLKQLFKIIELMGNKDLASRVQHINFGNVQGMSTRKGNVVFLDSILDDVGETMHAVMRKNEGKYSQVENPAATADILGISAVMVQDMTGKRYVIHQISNLLTNTHRINNYPYNKDAMTAFEGDTGPYLQYAHARLCSITRKAAIPEEELETADLSLLTETVATNLIRVVSQYPDVIQNTLKTLEPTTIVTYLFKMTHTLNTSYDHLRIVGSERELMKARLALYDAARIVLNNGMKVLGLSPVER